MVFTSGARSSVSLPSPHPPLTLDAPSIKKAPDTFFTNAPSIKKAPDTFFANAPSIKKAPDTFLEITLLP